MDGTRRHDRSAHLVRDALADLLGVGRDAVTIADGAPGGGLHLIAPVGNVRAVFKAVGSASNITGAINDIRRAQASGSRKTMPLIAVPFMGEVGQRLCAEAGVGWIDLSGNAHLQSTGLYIHVEGKPNRFKARGRPANVFAPKSARVARWLLIHPGRPMPQREIAQATGMDDGFVSRIAGRMVEAGLIRRLGQGIVVAHDPALLLTAWLERYQFSAHHLRTGFIAARSGEELVRGVARAFTKAGVSYAVTGLGAAWLHAHFAGFHTAAFYLRDEPAPTLLRAIGFRDEVRGANVWLAQPNDEGVFTGVAAQEGIQCVHPVQAYVDLAAQPEGAQEAAERLRKKCLRWKTADG